MADGPAAGGARSEGTTPLRTTSEVLRDLERERAGLIEALDRLKLETQAAKERLPSRRIAMIAAGALVGLLILRRAMRRRRERRLVDRIAEAVRRSD